MHCSPSRFYPENCWRRFNGPCLCNVLVYWQNWANTRPWFHMKNVDYLGGSAGIKAAWLLCFFNLLCIFDSPASLSLFSCSLFSQSALQYGSQRGSVYSTSEHHTDNLMIASGRPLDFIMGFYNGGTTAVPLFSDLFWFIQVKTTSPDRAVRPSINTSHPPFHSLALYLISSSSQLSDSNIFPLAPHSISQIHCILLSPSLLLPLPPNVQIFSFSAAFPFSLFCPHLTSQSRFPSENLQRAH